MVMGSTLMRSLFPPRPAIEIGCCRFRSFFECQSRVNPTLVGERSTREARRERGRFRESERVERPPHPHPLPACGEKEVAAARWNENPSRAPQNQIAIGGAAAPPTVRGDRGG